MTTTNITLTDDRLFALMGSALNAPTADYPDEELVCPNCTYSVKVHLGSKILCERCHVELGDEINMAPTWRSDHGVEHTHCNIPRNELLPESSLSTCLGGLVKNRIGKELQRTMTWNSVPHTERAMTSKLDDLGYACRRHYVQEAVIQGAEQLYHQLILESERRQNKRKRGNNDRGLQAAAVYLSFVSHHKPKTQREIAAIFDIEPKYVTQGLRIYEELLGRPSRITIYSDYVEEYSRALDLNKEQQDRIELVLERADRLKILETNTPTSTVAGCIYYVVLEYSLSIRPTDIAKRCGVSIPTITKVYDKLTKHAIDLL